jgi:riboflavin-specific deaminase-like protein
MEQAEVSAAVWDRLLDARAGRAPLSAGTRWSGSEAAAWSLYAPLADRTSDSPFLFAQVGQSLDGRIATVAGDARDISGTDGLTHLHRCRALADAVVIGIKTALHDDPRLTTRLVHGPNPVRVVIDPNGRLPNSANVLAADGVRRIVIQATDTARPDGVEVLRLPIVDGWISPTAIRKVLVQRGLRRILVEGGGVTIAGFLETGLLDRLHVTIAPLIIGSGPSGLRTTPVARLADALRPVTAVYGLGSEVVFDCALALGKAATSSWPTVHEVEPLAARRA